MTADAKEGKITELCRRFGISRQTAYRLIDRNCKETNKRLSKRIHAPHMKLNAIREVLKEIALELRWERPGWGPKRLKAHIERRREKSTETECQSMSAASSTEDAGPLEALIVRGGQRPGGEVQFREQVAHPDSPNRLWSIDYKGHVKTGNDTHCTTLTLTGNEGRYLLKVVAKCVIRTEHVSVELQEAFRQNELPAGIPPGHAPPLGQNIHGCTTNLSPCWKSLECRHEGIEPIKPHENGKQECFHLSLLQDRLNRGATWDLMAHQLKLERYQGEFNEERPHETLELRKPEGRFRTTAERCDSQTLEIQHGVGFRRPRLDEQITILWSAERIPISPVLAGENIGLSKTKKSHFAVSRGRIFKNWLQSRTKTIGRKDPAEDWRKKKTAA